MKVSFEGIGESVVTFYNSSSNGAAAGQVVKISGNGEVATCAAGDRFFGLALSCEGDYAAVQNGGYAVVSYSGTTDLSVGFAALSANGTGGVKADEDGGEFLIIEVDTVNKKAGLML